MPERYKGAPLTGRPKVNRWDIYGLVVIMIISVLRGIYGICAFLGEIIDLGALSKEFKFMAFSIIFYISFRSLLMFKEKVNK